MTKEMTPEEIASLNKEFDTANAFTKWKFMQTQSSTNFQMQFGIL